MANVETKISIFVKENMEEYEKLFQDWIKEEQHSGEINKSFSSLAVARHLYNSLSGLKVIAQTTSEKKTLEDIVKVSLSVLEN